MYKRKRIIYTAGHPCEAIRWHEFIAQGEEVELFGRNRADGSPIPLQTQNYLFNNTVESFLVTVVAQS
jgi:hypothetical protein